ncbi:MAG: exodeoxyribonuclease VII large subunit [Dysgonamonadaceae bacterium]|jgi:exodeoxyribonuclease VII large subunit|nr:exodeoxyribonuclease VII large subunit [Dysgonamonadaceae bacterium]
MEPLTLTALNRQVSLLIRETFSESYWLTAEVSDVRVNPNQGHCYLEFVEKDPKTQALVARSRGNIWSNTFRILKPYFEQATGQTFVSGIKVLVKVSIDFHELYGYSLNVLDIDPTYTLGDIQRQRQLILNQLAEEGVLDLNKELPFPLFPQRVAVISSATAAGYGDFLNQLEHNPSGFVFYPKLFPATMQGEKIEDSVIDALNRIYTYRELFDIVVIIRGGGATSDLHGFDSYLLAANCAQFPLPIITGIGHERDETVLDYVANKRAKTPTAVAAYLIDSVTETWSEMEEAHQSMVDFYGEVLALQKQRLQSSAYRLQTNTSVLLERHKTSLQLYQTHICNVSTQLIERKKHLLAVHEQFLQLSSPRHVLSRGYSVTLKDGKAVKSADALQKGDTIQTVFGAGKVESVVR